MAVCRIQTWQDRQPTFSIAMRSRYSTTRDIIVYAPHPDARLRLFCFPFAGGGASIYRTWGQHARAALEVCAVQLPGREGRFSEPPFRSMEPLLDYLELSLKPYLDRPFAIFGHSMGGLVGFELARRLTQRGLPGPCHIFISGHGAPHCIEETAFHQLPDSDLVDHLRRWQGTPDAVLASAEMLGLVLPCLRADLEVLETYRHEEREPLACPISVFGGMDDEHTSQEHLAAWARHTHAPFIMRLLPGSHFFLQQERDAILAAVRQDLQHLLAA